MPPDGVLGEMNPSGNAEVFFTVGTDSRVTGYKLYYSQTGAGGPFTSLGIATRTTITLTEVLTLNGLSTYDIYLYVVSTGTLPDSAPSRMVHAVSTTTLTSSLSLSASGGATPVFTITGGSVPAVSKRTWELPATPPYDYWYWGDDGAPLSNPVTFGSMGFGVTYVSTGPLPPSGTPVTVLVDSFNGENWRVDESKFVFSAP